jgi:hypothetical protein
LRQTLKLFLAHGSHLTEKRKGPHRQSPLTGAAFQPFVKMTASKLVSDYRNAARKKQIIFHRSWL